MIVEKPFEKDFVNTGGSICPFCGKALWLNDYCDSESSSFRQRVKRNIKCGHCNKEFLGIYNLVECKAIGESWTPKKKGTKYVKR